MHNRYQPRWLKWVLLAVGVGYVIWSQLTIQSYQRALATETDRIYNIAAYCEFFKEVAINHNATLHVDQLERYPRSMEITAIEPPEASSPGQEQERLYIMTYDPVDQSDKTQLHRYFSELVLGNYFYIKTQENGKIKEIFWDKP